MAVKRLQTVENAVRVLEALSEAQPVGVSALARRMGMDKNAVQRVLVTLGDIGWIRPSGLGGGGGGWELTARALVVGRRYAPRLRDRARPHLERLQDATGETAILWAVEGDRVVVLDAVDSAQPLRLTVAVGTDIALRDAGAFRAFVGGDDAGMRGEDAAALRRRGWYVVVDDLYPNVCAVGAPVVDPHGTTVGAITVVGPTTRMPAAVQRRYGALVLDATRRMASAGW